MTDVSQAQRRLNLQYLRECLELWDSWQCPVTFPGVPNGDQLAKEYVALVRKMVAKRNPMAGRKPQTKDNEPATCRGQASQLLERLQAHKEGRLKMTRAQIMAAKIVIGKVIPVPKRRTHR